MPYNLQTLQKDFMDYVLSEANIQILKNKLINTNDNLLQYQLDIYRNNIFTNLKHTLSAIYPITREVIGSGEFDIIVRDYISNNNSNSGNLDNYGQYFSQFLKSKPKELAGIAHIEWQYHLLSLQKGDIRTINIQELRSLPENDYENINFLINHTLNILESSFPVYSIWKNRQLDDNSSKNPENIAIFKEETSLNIIKLSNIEVKFIKLSQRNQTLYQIYEILSKENIDIGNIIAKLIESKIIVGIGIIA